jgi:hypothetical protein
VKPPMAERAAEVSRWHAAWQRLSGSAGPTGPDVGLSLWSLGTVESVNPIELGVHPAIKVTEGDRRRGDRAGPLPSLPAYVPRDFDRQLRATVRRARSQGGMIILVGNSCMGKTRSALQALRDEAPRHELLLPAGPAALDDMMPALYR